VFDRLFELYFTGAKDLIEDCKARSSKRWIRRS